MIGSRRIFAGFVLLLLGALTAWWAWPAAPAPMPTAGPAANADAQQRPDAASGPAAAAGENGAAAAAGDGPASHRAPVAAAADGLVGLAVRVVDAATRAPVADAIVRAPQHVDWNAMPADERAALEALLRRDVEQYLERTGVAAATDAEGRCVVSATFAGFAQVTARRGERFGMRVVRQGQTGEVEIALRPDHTLRVLVEDARGPPAAGVTVDGAGVAGTQHDLHLGATDVNGRVERRHVQADLGNDETSRRVRLRAVVPGAASPAVEVDLAAPPPEVVLRLPATGTVTVRVLEADGSPVAPRFLDDPVVRLAAIPPGGKQQDAAAAFVAGPTRAVLGDDGVATFAFVGLDQELVARQDDFTDARKFAGPTLQNPHGAVTLQRSALGAVLAGRVLDAGGEPVGAATWRLAFRAGRMNGAIPVRTADDGRFRVHFGVPFAGRELALRWCSPPDAAAPVGVELPPRTLAAGTNDLGDLRLQPFRVLLAGRFVRDDPAAAGWPLLEIDRRDGDGWAADSDLRRSLRAPAPDCFALYGVLAEGTPLRLRVPDGAWRSVEPIETAVGAAEVVVELHAAGSVVAMFVGDEATPLSRLEYRLLRTAPPPLADVPWSSAARLRDSLFDGAKPVEGRLQRTWQGLEAGTYRLAVHGTGAEEPLLQLDSLLVATGPCADPRLQSIDLRGLVQRIVVRATGADGAPVPDEGSFALPLGNDGTPRAAIELAGGTAELLAPGPLDILVTARGHRSQRLAGCTGEVAVRLQPAAGARIALVLPCPLPDDVTLWLLSEPRFAGVSAAAVPTGRGRTAQLEAMLTEKAPLRASGTGASGLEAEVPVRAPGPHRLTVLLDGYLPVGPTEPATVDLGGDGGPVVRVTVPEPVLRGALANRPR